MLSLIRRHGSVPKAEIARLTGLSAQTISVIMRQLEADGLVVKEAPQRGKIGQPSVPFSLNPDGAFFLGLKIGRRSTDLVLLDFLGRPLKSLHEPCRYPTPDGILRIRRARHRGARRDAAAAAAAPASPASASPRRSSCGTGRSRSALRARCSTAGGISTSGRRSPSLCDWPVYFCNDATAACGAELVLGNPGHALDFLYFFIGSFVGGGVVLNGSLYPGRSGNAGALGSLPIPAAARGGGRVRSSSSAALRSTCSRSR